MDTLDTARQILALGLTPIPVPKGKKGAVKPNWIGLKYDSDFALQETFSNPTNIGVLIGEYIDIDCENNLISELSQEFLPKTAFAWGRPGNPHSHMLFKPTSGRLKKTLKFSSLDKELWLELRTGNYQSLIPPSVHPEGDVYAWSEYSDPIPAPTEAPIEELTLGAFAILMVAQFSHLWQSGVNRHDHSLALAGLFYKIHIPENYALRILEKICLLSSDPEIQDRLRTVADTYSKGDQGETISGFKGAGDILGKDLLSWFSRISENLRGESLVVDLPENLPDLSDAGNATCLFDIAKEDICFPATLQEWYRWNETEKIWQQTPVEALIYSYMVPIRQRWEQEIMRSSDAQANLITRHMRKLSSAATVTTAFNLSQNLFLENTPKNFADNTHRINFTNGALDTKNLVFDPTDKKHYMSYKLPYKYDPKARCPQWLDFISLISGHNPAMAQFLQDIAGYIIAPTSPRYLFFMFGQGMNGKTTFSEVLRLLLTDQLAIPIDSAVFLSGQKSDNFLLSSAAKMFGKLAAFASEVPIDMHLSEMAIKTFANQAPLTAKRLYQEPFSFIPQARVFFSGNSKPIIKDITDGFWRRFVPIPFTVNIGKELPPEKLRHRFHEEVVQDEASGIFNWMLDGLARLAATNYNIAFPEIVSTEMQKYRKASNPLAMFLADEYEEVPGTESRFAEVYDSYRTWCATNLEKAYSSRVVRAGLEALGVNFIESKSSKNLLMVGYTFIGE